MLVLTKQGCHYEPAKAEVADPLCEVVEGLPYPVGANYYEECRQGDVQADGAPYKELCQHQHKGIPHWVHGATYLLVNTELPVSPNGSRAILLRLQEDQPRHAWFIFAGHAEQKAGERMCLGLWPSY